MKELKQTVFLTVTLTRLRLKLEVMKRSLNSK